MAKKKPSSFIGKIVVSVFGIGILVAAFIVYKGYRVIYSPNVTLHGKSTEYFYVRTGWDLKDVVNALYERNYIINRNGFEWVAEKKNFKNHVKPGRYLLKTEMSNEELINLLRSGQQAPLKVTFGNVRLKTELAGKATANIEADSMSLLLALQDQDIAAKYGFDTSSFISMFLPNTYELYWNTSVAQFIGRMAKEYKQFWNEERREKAKELGLTQTEVSTLASIVQKETKELDEKPRVAGVYLNRLRKDMLLQADPTLIFALGDFTIKRVLNVHKKIDSPYNTYRYKGLPPGPITLPEISSIDAVLNAENHQYLYFCAKDDFSGYHNFAKTYRQHLKNARKFQKALNKRKIYR